MAGTFEKRGNGYRLKYSKNGIRYCEKVNCTTDKEARIALADFVTRINKGNYYDTNYTFYEFAQIWIDQVQKPNSSPITVEKYKSYLNNRIIPYIGRYRLKELSVPILTNYFNIAKNFETLTKIPRPISKATLEKIVEIVTAILQKAFEWELIAFNPCNRIKVKYDNMKSEINKNKILGEKKNEIVSYSKEEYKKVLEALSKEFTPFNLFVETALKTGFSKEEILGLRWTDFDFTNKTLSVRIVRLMFQGQLIEKQPKARSRLRTITIPSSLAESLKKYSNNSEYIFDEINPNSLNWRWKKFCKDNYIRHIRIHDLRHTHATILLAQGVDIKTISERLGHSNISITMNVYTDVLKELDKTAAEKIDNL